MRPALLERCGKILQFGIEELILMAGVSWRSEYVIEISFLFCKTIGSCECLPLLAVRSVDLVLNLFDLAYVNLFKFALQIIIL